MEIVEIGNAAIVVNAINFRDSADYKALLLGLSTLRDGVMKALCCDYQAFVLRTTSVVLPRKVRPK